MEKFLKIVSTLFFLSILFFGCKKDKIDDLYPEETNSSIFTGSVVDANTSKPLVGVPVMVLIFRSFGSNDKFGPFLTDSFGKFVFDIDVIRKFDSAVYEVNVAGIPFQEDFLEPFDSTATPFKYTFFKFQNNNLDVIKDRIFKLDPLGKVIFELNDLNKQYDSMYVSSLFSKKFVKSPKNSTGIFFLEPSKIHTFTVGGFKKGKEISNKKVDFFVPNAFSSNGNKAILKRTINL